jgi:hypothetical protein
MLPNNSNVKGRDMYRTPTTVRNIATAVLLGMSLFLAIGGATSLAGDFMLKRLSLDSFHVFMGMCALGMAGLAVLVLRRD